MNATTLRETLTRSAGPHADALVDPLLDVLEAAEGLPAPRHREYCPCSDWPDRECDCGALDERSALNDAIAALYRRAGEVMDGK